MGSEVVHEVSSPIPRRDSSTAAWGLGLVGLGRWDFGGLAMETLGKT